MKRKRKGSGCQGNGLIKMIPTIPHNLSLSHKPGSLCYGIMINLDKPRLKGHQLETLYIKVVWGNRLNYLGMSVSNGSQKSLITELDIHPRLKSCVLEPILIYFIRKECDQLHLWEICPCASVFGQALPTCFASYLRGQRFPFQVHSIQTLVG